MNLPDNCRVATWIGLLCLMPAAVVMCLTLYPPPRQPTNEEVFAPHVGKVVHSYTTDGRGFVLEFDDGSKVSVGSARSVRVRPVPAPAEGVTP